VTSPPQREERRRPATTAGSGGMIVAGGRGRAPFPGGGGPPLTLECSYLATRSATGREISCQLRICQDSLAVETDRGVARWVSHRIPRSHFSTSHTVQPERERGAVCVFVFCQRAGRKVLCNSRGVSVSGGLERSRRSSRCAGTAETRRGGCPMVPRGLSISGLCDRTTPLRCRGDQS
jgi:hypothetical protein